MSIYVNAGRLFQNALQFQKSASSVNAVSDQAQREFLAGIVFAVFSAEAFVNELQQLAVTEGQNTAEPGWVKALGIILGDAESSRLSTESKFQLAVLVLTGNVLDPGGQPFQDFKLLMDMRNKIVHSQPSDAVRQKDESGQWHLTPKVFARLAERGAVCREDELFSEVLRNDQIATIRSNLLAEVSVQETAIWACKAASAIVNAVIDALPSSERFSPLIETLYRKDFSVS